MEPVDGNFIQPDDKSETIATIALAPALGYDSYKPACISYSCEGFHRGLDI